MSQANVLENVAINRRMLACMLEALRDIYGLSFTVMPRHRYGLRGTAWHIWSIGRCDNRRISMCPIPGNIIRVVDVARYRLRNIRRREFASRWSVKLISHRRPEGSCVV